MLPKSKELTNRLKRRNRLKKTTPPPVEIKPEIKEWIGKNKMV